MNYNPFEDELVPPEYDLALFDRSGEFRKLNSVANREDVCRRYISPRGTGKSTLLDTYFSREKRREMAQKKKRLLQICRFSGDEMRTDAEVFARLIKAVKDSLRNLGTLSDDYRELSQVIQALEQEKPNYWSDAVTGQELLEGILSFLREQGYSVTLVMDEFHQLACAQNVQETIFSAMAAIQQAELISYVVASDYDDEVGTQSYYTSPFSRIFDNCTVNLKGISSPKGKQALMELLRGKLEEEPDTLFTDEELLHLIELTGGIPGLLNAALAGIFEIKQKTNREFSAQQLTQYTHTVCAPLMEKWVQYCDDKRWRALEAVLRYVFEPEVTKHVPIYEDVKNNRKINPLTSLCEAGLIVLSTDTQEYHPICPLFGQYIQNELPRRLRNEENPALAIPSVAGLAPGQPVNIYHVQNVYNDKVVQGDDHSQNLHAENVQIQNGLSVSDVLHILGDGSGDTRELFASRLSEQLRRYIPANGLELPPRETFDTEEAYQQSYDEAFDAMSKKVVQDVEVDEDMDLAVTPAELQTLDERFEDARRRCRPDLSDQILEAQEERCRFYLKLSVVVEDALNLPGIQMEDYSPQLVLYGKALEQALRDSFFKLFHNESVMSATETTKRDKDGNLITFAQAGETDAYIGTYTFMLKKHQAHLAKLCLDHPVQMAGTPADLTGWIDWWNRLQADADAARVIRNKADHADRVSPGQDSLNRMYGKLFGTGTTTGVLPRLAIGNRLYRNLFPPAITMDVIQKLKGQVCQIRCLEVKTNGGIKGETLEGGYMVKLSPKRVAAFRKANGCETVDFTGKMLTVKIVDFSDQHNQEFFAAEPVSLETAAAAL